jgi:hypothetical protein
MTESLEASVTLKRLLAGVQPLVLLQMMLVLERLAAVLVGARVRSILGGVAAAATGFALGRRLGRFLFNGLVVVVVVLLLMLGGGRGRC